MTENSLNNVEEPTSEDIELLDKIQSLPPEEKLSLTQTLEMYSGPIPHPQILAQFDALAPGSAKKIINNGVGESVHRRRLENVRGWGKMGLSYIMTISFFVLMSGFMYGSYLLVMDGHPVIGGIGGGLSFITLFGSISNLITGLTEKDDYKKD